MDVLHFLRDRLLDAAASGALQVSEPVRDELDRRRLLAGRSGGAGAQVEIPALPSHTELKQRVPDRDRDRFSASGDPLESVAAFVRAMRGLVGDPSLDLYTAGTRVMRERYPIAPYEELLRAEAIDRSQPLVVQVQGDFALVGSESPVRGFAPILLAREAGLWRVDLVETYKNFFFDESGRYRLVNRATPYAAFVSDPDVDSDESLRPLDLHGEPLEAAIERLEASDLPTSRFRLAEILMRNCWVTSEAIPLYVDAVRAAPDEAHFASVLADRASYLGMPEIAIAPIERLGPSYWPRLARLHERAGQPARARMYYEKALARDPRSRDARAGLERLTREQQEG